jgi:hypothetical protein
MISKPFITAALLTVVLAPGVTSSSRLLAQQSPQWVVPPGFQVSEFADVENP